MNFIYLIPTLLSILLILTSLLGILKNKNNILLIFIHFELNLLGVSLLYFFGTNLFFFNNSIGNIIALFILILAACESCIGLAILINFFKLKGSINTYNLNSLII